MLVFISIIIVVLGSATTIHGAEDQYIKCLIQGDPRLSSFALNATTSLSPIFCGLRNSPTTFFRNRFIRIEIVNNGSAGGNIVSFIVSLLDESDSDDDVCTFTEQYFKLPARNFTCGLAKITMTRYSMQIQQQEADLFVTIYNATNNYNIDILTSWENANKSRGMCRDGCTSLYTTNARTSGEYVIPQDQTTSLLAQQICDMYLKEYIKPNAPVPTKLIQFVEKTHQGCVIDVTNMGDKQYAEQALISIVSTIMTFNATSLEQIERRTQEAAIIASQLSKIADQVTTKLIADYKAKNSINN